jgi:hypothetical protein
MSSQAMWTIEKLWVQPQVGDLSNVVMTAEWRCIAENGNTISGNSTFSTPAFADFTPYDQVTEAQVLVWCWSGSIQKEAVEMSISNPAGAAQELPSPPLPWNSAT